MNKNILDELANQLLQEYGISLNDLVEKRANELAEEKIAQAKAELTEEYENMKKELEESANKYGEYLAKQMQNKLDSYLDHVVDCWLEDNRIAVENGLKVEMFDSMMEGMKELFIENNVSYPEESIDVVTSMEENIQDLESQLDSMVIELTRYKDYAKYVEKQVILDEATKDMTEAQKEKVSDLAGSIRFDENFKSNLEAVIKFALDVYSEQ